ncbi:importin-4 isoform X2 [Bombina bombina]|uniref:importin-4 isoform X2 n=1 Tax=Bombina bombina TaxID=8345 RepID=UPI00235A752F|nr:importin-4 isoform X2 [Bombina bombina]
MAQILESILINLLQPDNAVIQQATAQLKEAVKDPLIIPALCDVLRGAQDSQIRQFAAVLLRRRLIKSWKSITGEQQEILKSLLLETIQREPEHKVRHALAQLSAVILKNVELTCWPQFIKFVQDASRSTIPEERQVGLLVLRCALDLNAELFRSNFPDLIRLFQHTLNESQNQTLLFYTLQSLTSIVPELGAPETNLLRPLIPKLLIAIRQIISVNEDQACEAMEVFDELMESEASVIVHYIADVTNFCLEVCVNTSLSDNLRVKALSCITFLIKLKSKSILKQKLLPHILNTLFPIMCAEPPTGEMDPEDQDDEEEMEADAEVQTPKHYAVQVIDMLALHLSPEKLIPHLSPLMEPCLLSTNPYQRKAGLLCLAVLSEGCADYIRKKHLQSMLQLLCQAISDDSQVVRNAALFALGQFSENLQPDISQYSDTVLPLLLGYIARVDHSQTSHLTKAYYALENFVENLGNNIEPYIPTLMELILVSLGNSNNRMKELAVSLLGAIANAAEELLRPYFPSIMESLKIHLMQSDEKGRPVQIQCLETLGVMVRTLGKEIFLPLAEDCCHLGLGLCDRIDDPDLRRCVYSLFAALSVIMGDSISSHLDKITTLMLLSLRSREGIVIHYSENHTFMLFDDEDDAEDGDTVIEDEDEYNEIEGFSVENSYIDEKQDACMALGEIACNASASFFPYLDSCFQEVCKHTEGPHNSVRSAAFEALVQFVCSMNMVCQRNPNEVNTTVLQSYISHVIPALLRGIMQDKERLVVMGILENLNKLLKDVKSLCVQNAERLEELCLVIRAVLQNKTACQDPEFEDEDEQQPELDSMLIEHAGEGIPLVAAAVGGATFAPYFVGFLPLLLNKTKPSCSVAQKSFSLGTLAECTAVLGTTAEQFVPQIFPAMLSGAKDEDDEVRSNSVFGLGVLAEHGGASMHQHYPKLLTLFSSLISSDKDLWVRDNVCGAVSRMIISHPQGVPIGQVFPVMLSTLPLKKDFEETTTVVKCITFLYEHFSAQVIEQINNITRFYAHVLGTKEIKPVQDSLILHLKDMEQRFPQDLKNAVNSLPAKSAAKLQVVIGRV